MSYINKKSANLLALGLLSVAGVSTLSVTETVKADTYKEHSAGDFDLTKQATKADYPIMFDRPIGVNAAALGNAVVNLGTSSDLYKSAVKAVPELQDVTIVNNLLNKAMNGDATARATIVKLINWYNSLGGTQITTQSGQAYTVDNLDETINTIAVAFTNGDTASNAKVSTTIQSKFGNVKTVKDVMTSLDSYGNGISDKYTKAFDAYNNQIKANGADLKKLTTYEAVKPVLDAYEGMYADGASIIRKTVLSESGATEAAIAFFESAVLSPVADNNDKGDTNKTEVKKTTKWVDKSGKELTPPETGEDFKDKKDFPGLVLIETKVEGNTKTYVYDKTPEKEVTTSWVDEKGNPLKSTEKGTKDAGTIPGYDFVKTNKDNDGNITHVFKKTPDKEVTTSWVDKSGKPIKTTEKGVKEHGDIPGYKYVKTIKDKDGNVIHIFEKVDILHTYWFDIDGKELKNKAEGTLPDKEGDDITGYTLVQTHVITQNDLNGSFKDSATNFKVGDVLNIYKKTPNVKVTTEWINDKTGEALKPKQEGSHPDKEGDDISGYKLVSVKTDDQGNVVNSYVKQIKTTWVDKNGKPIKPSEDGEKEHGDVPGYKFIETKKDKDGNVVHIFEKINIVTNWVDQKNNPLKPAEEGSKEAGKISGYKFVETKKDENGNVTHVFESMKTTTIWVDETGKQLQESKEGEFPDKEGDDIKGYTLVHTNTKTLENGDKVIENVYKVDAKKVITHYVDDKGNRLVDDIVGEDFDKARSFNGYKLKEERLSKDGKEKFYVYEKVKEPEKIKAKQLPETGDSTLPLGLGVVGLGLAGVLSRRKKEQ